jgi:hypothetical protein
MKQQRVFAKIRRDKYRLRVTNKRRKTTPPILRCRGNVFRKPLSCKDKGVHGPTDSPLILQGPHRKRCVLQFFFVPCISCRGNVLTEPLPSKVRGIHRSTDSASILQGSHGKQFFVSYISCCENVFTEPLPSNVKGGIHIQKLELRGYKLTKP